MISEERDALILSVSAAATNFPVMAKYRYLMKGTAENQDPFWASSISLPRLAPMSAKWQFVKMKKDIIDLELFLIRTWRNLIEYIV